MAKAITVRRERVVEIKVIGKRPENRPYLRLAYLDNGMEGTNGYIGSVCNANALRGLANQILRALDG